MLLAINNSSSLKVVPITGPGGAKDSINLMPGGRVELPRFWSVDSSFNDKTVRVLNTATAQDTQAAEETKAEKTASSIPAKTNKSI